MGMATGGSGDGPQSDINVTPLVDVCLVLLIIFMVMIPRNVPEISVRVPPESKTKAPPSQRSESIVLGLSKEGAITLNNKQVDRGQLGAELNRLMQYGESVIFVNFDDDVPYGDCVALLDLAKRSGASVLGIYKDKNKPIPDTLVGL